MGTLLETAPLGRLGPPFSRLTWARILIVVAATAVLALQVVAGYQESQRRTIRYSAGIGLDIDLKVNRVDASARAVGFQIGDYVRELAGRRVETIVQYRRVLQVHPDHVGAHHNLANALVQFGRFKEAVQHYQQALRIMPDQPTVLDNLAWLLATCPEPEVRDGTRAVRLAERACGLIEPTPPHILDTLAHNFRQKL